MKAIIKLGRVLWWPQGDLKVIGMSNYSTWCFQIFTLLDFSGDFISNQS